MTTPYSFFSRCSKTSICMMPTTPAVKWLDTLHLPRTEANIEWITHRMGLDRPLAVQYGIQRLLGVGFRLGGRHRQAVLHDVLQKILRFLGWDFGLHQGF